MVGFAGVSRCRRNEGGARNGERSRGLAIPGDKADLRLFFWSVPDLPSVNFSACLFVWMLNWTDRHVNRLLAGFGFPRRRHACCCGLDVVVKIERLFLNVVVVKCSYFTDVKSPRVFCIGQVRLSFEDGVPRQEVFALFLGFWELVFVTNLREPEKHPWVKGTVSI